jgi:DNA-binding MarR family transcriptional regulator
MVSASIANAVHRRFQQSLDDLGVTVTQLGLAVHLAELGPLSGADLSRGFHIAPQSVGTAPARLEKLGWVERGPHPVHGRVVLYELSAKGLAGVRLGRVSMAEVSKRITQVLPGRDAAKFIEELRCIVVDLDGPDRPIERLWPLAAQ